MGQSLFVIISKIESFTKEVYVGKMQFGEVTWNRLLIAVYIMIGLGMTLGIYVLFLIKDAFLSLD